MLLIPSRLFSPFLIIYSILFSSSLTSAQLCSNFTIFCYDFMVQRFILPGVSILSFGLAFCASFTFSVVIKPSHALLWDPSCLLLETSLRKPAVFRLEAGRGGFLAAAQLTPLFSQRFFISGILCKTDSSNDFRSETWRETS